jgi:hypothetical protein
MDNRPIIDREMLVPIVIGVFSLLGILVVLLIWRSVSAPALVAMTPSATPFQFLYLGTEPAVGTLPTDSEGLLPTLEEQDPGGTASAGTPVIGTPVILSPGSSTRISPSPTRSSGATQSGLQPVEISSTPGGPIQISSTPGGPVQISSTPGVPVQISSTSSAAPAPLGPGTYEDAYILNQFTSTGLWVPSTNGSRTLHVSSTQNNSITLRFVGREILIGYDDDPTFGEITVTIDNQTETFSQQSGNEWVSNTFPSGTHTVVITHSRGGSVNLDYVTIPQAGSTATPSPTATQNQ